ncbi:hypothetical protein ACFC7A_31575 [Streptomyces niveus]|uniref:hypothetical protein n=1 Tax=Streptomyces niveus TaxID=193462 RepID=UPI0035D728B4
MAAYRIAYAGQAEASLRALPRQRRTQIDGAMRSTIAKDPYGHGSTAPRTRERDYREVALPGVNAIVVYFVSAPAALTITAVRLISL